MSEWRTIETAPKGFHILTYAKDGKPPVSVSVWIDNEDGGTWRDDGREPTHWMPLPEPPK